ncbi:MAG: hypothetical protein ACFFH0_09745 [Promethearchaeota archaeon]
MDFLPWIIRAILIVVAIILAIVIWRGKKEGKYQEYYIRFFIIGITAFIMGAILLIVFFITNLLFDYALFLTITGATAVIIGLVVRYTWERNR